VTIAQYFKGLADQTRLRMLNLLFQDELCGCDIQHVLEISQSNVSRHLNYLKRAGLVLDRRDGYRVFYRLADTPDRSRTLLFEYLRTVFRRDAVCAADLEELKTAIRDGACTRSERPARRAGRPLPSGRHPVA
jgi:ArsR family transcriptional regulator, arsenate/arsenite/antimonite-responsive transcriptional repressor